jgi:hypothetical protein
VSRDWGFVKRASATARFFESLIPSPKSRHYQLRSRLLPLAVLGGARPGHRGRRMASRWWPFQKDFQKAAPSTPARPTRRVELSDPAVSTATPCRNQASLPVIDMRRPRLRSLTAIASGRSLGRLPSKFFLPPLPLAGEGWGEGGFSRNGEELPHPPLRGTFSRQREKGQSFT